MQCLVCGIELENKRTDARYCSPKCRKEASRNKSVVTDNVTLSNIPVTLNFEFVTISKANGLGRTRDEQSKVRKAVYWYDVPIAAVPIIKKDWPEMPEHMNGRQYFLWWKNEFKENDKGPVLYNPFG